MPNKRMQAGLIALAIVLISVISIILFNRQAQVRTTTLVLGAGTSTSKEYRLENITTSADQTKGLSGRNALDADKGMLFVYENVEKRCMWMKDMKFNIDIVWLDGNKRVSSIVRNLAPSTYPQSYCADAQYVVELKAGEVDKHNLRVGQVIKL